MKKQGSNEGSGAYVLKAPKRLRARPKTDKNMLNFLRLRLQYTANLLSKFIREEYQREGLKAISGLLPSILALDKISNSYMKVMRAHKTTATAKEEKAHSWADLLLEQGEEGKDNGQ